MQQKDTLAEPGPSMSGRRIYSLAVGTDARQGDWAEVSAGARTLGFDTLCLPLESLPDEASITSCARAAAGAGLGLLLDCPLPLRVAEQVEVAVAAATRTDVTLALLLRDFSALSSPAGRDPLHRLHERHAHVGFTVWTPGLTPDQVVALQGLPLAGVYSSLPWWNFRDDWLIEEHERLRAVAPVIAPLADPRSQVAADPLSLSCRLAAAAMSGEAVLVTEHQVQQLEPDELAALMAMQGNHSGAMTGGLRRLTGPLAALTALFRFDDEGRLLLLNPDARGQVVDRSLIERRLPDAFVLLPAALEEAARVELPAHGWQFLPLVRADSIARYGTSSRQQRGALARAMRSSRIAIESVRPQIDGGLFAVKRSLGERVRVSATIFMDGHEQLAAELLWRPVDEAGWGSVAMRPLGNDAWEADFLPGRLGRYVFMIRAWHDSWRSFCVQLEKKAAAHVDLRLEVEDGRRMLQERLEKARALGLEEAETLEETLQKVGLPVTDSQTRQLRPRLRGGRATPPAPAQDIAVFPPVSPEQVQALLDASVAAAMDRIGPQAFEASTPTQYPVSVESGAALFSSWYELFPRSQSPRPGRHGRLRDVMRRLPQIRRMGFDVLYFPPIHPIGERNRKGRNNALQAEPGDPGSPYAIGSAHGGHDAVHPELGTLSDFRELLAAARAHGLEIALDFAIQCSPDHPWLREHPDWFNWRADGSLKHAENPPKRYEDIVNPDFYSPLASTPRQAALWRALRDIVLFWIQQGVRIFRVDNPHTKPLPFWEWMLREVRDRHPDTLFLSEAFTRPAMMYRLAKLGFSQSYTYFTWRNTRQELTDYLTELNRAPVRDFFRPNFFVNTPDINPWFLQTSGRAGFLIRAVLAGTLSGSWGMYNGFELCVADAMPGKEEYLDSEKYQLRQWDLEAPGNIIEEITRLNRIRRNHPAMQSHLGIRFLPVDNEQILFYERQSAEGDSVVLVAVSLDPHQRQAGRLELPLQEWGLGDHGMARLHDLFEDHRFTVQGRWLHTELTPERPFVLWARVPQQGEQA